MRAAWRTPDGFAGDLPAAGLVGPFVGPLRAACGLADCFAAGLAGFFAGDLAAGLTAAFAGRVA